MICKDCYGRGIKHHFDMVAGIGTVGPCKCSEQQPKSVERSNLIKNLAEKNQMNEEQVKEYLGVII